RSAGLESWPSSCFRLKMAATRPSRGAVASEASLTSASVASAFRPRRRTSRWPCRRGTEFGPRRGPSSPGRAALFRVWDLAGVGLFEVGGLARLQPAGGDTGDEPHVGPDVGAGLAAAPAGDVEPAAGVQVHPGRLGQPEEHLLLQGERGAAGAQLVPVDLAPAP